MKYIYMCVCIVFNMHIMSLFAGITVQSRTSAIYHRYYLIKRLEQSCKLLQNISVQQHIPFELLDATLFISKSIKLTVEAMKNEKNTEPLLVLWDDFCTYKEINNKLFKHEFIELIYAVYDLMSPKGVKRLKKSLEHTLMAIDCATDAKLYTMEPVRTLPQELTDVTTDLVAKRFYIIKRLQKSMNVLERLHVQNFCFSDDSAGRSYTALIKEIEHFHHDRVRESVMQMCQTKNLEPLLRLCDEVKQYRFAQDESFLQEMLMNIFLVYKTILLRHGSHHVDPVIVHEMNHVLEIYEHLNSLPLDQTLEAIDEVTDRLMAIQSQESVAGNYTPWVLSGVLCGLVSIGTYYYFLHHG